MSYAHLSYANLSLPSWECGLKFFVGCYFYTIKESLPSWECGLKWYLTEIYHWCYRHSLRGSVDWNSSDTITAEACNVTPFVGVWIEISLTNVGTFSITVTPFVGVWIEINECHQFIVTVASLPSWECGLKYNIVSIPFSRTSSLPSWECGLKLPCRLA